MILCSFTEFLNHLGPHSFIFYQVLAACVAAASAQGFFGLQSLPNGAVVPIDEPAVQAARADHFAAKGVVAGPAVYGAGYGYNAGYGYANGFYGLQSFPNGAVVPVDEPAVAAARADHFAAKGAVASYAAAPVAYAAAPAVAAAPVAAYSGYAPAYGYAGPLNLNFQLIAHPNGAVVPVDEPAVAAARADHLAAKGHAYAAAAPVAYAASPVAYAAAPVAYAAAPAVAAPVAYGYGYNGPLNLNTQLVAHPNGAVVPADEPAVAAARADHLATKGVVGGVYANAGPAVYGAGYASGFYGLQSFPNGAVVPVDEPAVAAARADHFAAHAAQY